LIAPRSGQGDCDSARFARYDPAMPKPNQRQPNAEPTGGPLADPTLFSVPDAAERLGVSTDAVRMRVKRGTLPAERIDGRLFVRLPGAFMGNSADPTATEREPTPTQRLPNVDLLAVIASKDETISAQAVALDRADADLAYLRGELSGALRALSAERERSDTLQRIALDRIEALTAGLAQTDGATATEPLQTAEDALGATEAEPLGVESNAGSSHAPRSVFGEVWAWVRGR